MVNPINGDKPLAAATERSGESSKNSRSQQAASGPASAPENQAIDPASSVEVDKARQLYDLESLSTRPVATEISTPEEARSLLNQVLEQIASKPEQAMQSQGSSATSPLANLLQAVPG